MPPTGKDPTKKVTFADRIRDAKVNLHCIVCGMGSNRTDWTKTDNSSYVACDGHTEEEISDAVAKQRTQENATANNDAAAAGGPASSADLTPTGGSAADGGKTQSSTKTPTGSETTVKTPLGTKPVAAPLAANTSVADGVTSPTAGQQTRSTQSPTAAPNAQDAGKDVKATPPGQNAPPGVDPTKAA